MSKSSGKDKERTLTEKFKQMFGLSKAGSTVTVSTVRPRIDEFTFSPEILKEISSESQLPTRLKFLKEIGDVAGTKRFEENAVEALCYTTKDLLQSPSIDARHAVLNFYKLLIQGQCENYTIMRAFFFRIVKQHNIQEDLVPRLEMLKALTDNGKVIQYFEEEAGAFLLEWTEDVIAAGHTLEYLALLITLIKFNATYLDADVIAGFVNYACSWCLKSSSSEEIQLCLDMLDAIICYSYLPPDILHIFATTLCQTLNVEKFSQHSWKVMRNMLGTHMGHSGIQTLCSFMLDRNNDINPGLLRGAVSFVSMALWGSKCVPTLRHVPATVLPAFLQAIQYGHSEVAYEVVLSLQRLIQKHGEMLNVVAWEVLLNILDVLVFHPQVQTSGTSYPLATGVHNLLSSLEQLLEQGSYSGSVDRLFAIIAKCSSQRPEASVLSLIQYYAESLHPTKERWLSNLNLLMDRFYKQETRSVIKIKVLDILSCIFVSYRHLYEVELIDGTMLLYLFYVDTEQDHKTRNVAIQLLINVAQDCRSKQCRDILDIIDKVIHRLSAEAPSGGNRESSEGPPAISEEDVLDLKSAVKGLVRIFKKTICTLHYSSAVQAYQILVNFIQQQYRVPVPEETSSVRYLVVEFFLQLKTNEKRQLGVVNIDGQVEYSPYIICVYREPKSEKPCGGATSPPMMSPASSFSGSGQIPLALCMHQVLLSMITCLKEERDWTVMQLVLNGLPQFLQNKTFAMCADGSVSKLCCRLHSMVTDRSHGLPENLHNASAAFTRTDFHSHVFPVLASLVAYHQEIGVHVQRILIKSLQFGLVSKCAPTCIVALMLCTLEMQEVMYKMLPEVLLNLSKISATINIAVPILEFLSTLIRLPDVYSSFVEDQFMSIFAIALPYTNPFKFNQYIVALAHHVIAMWFLKCPILFRKDFVPFITKNLRANMLVPLEENMILSQAQGIDDASQRRRSSSLNEQGSRSESRIPYDTALVTLHTELMETCIDLMAQYTFGMCSVIPKRSSITQFLLENGQSLSWLLGNKVVTITTSGCGTKTYREGMCEKCYRLCKGNSTVEPERPSPTVPVQRSQSARELQHSRRRHKSDIYQGSGRHHRQSAGQSKDDLLMMHQQSLDESSRQPSLTRGHSLQETVTSRVKTTTSQAPPLEEQSSNESQQDWKQDFKGAADKPEILAVSNLCSCWCQGWVELLIRRPTGNTSWMMRIQNFMFLPSSLPDFPLSEMMMLYLPSCDDDTAASLSPSNSNQPELTPDDTELEAEHGKITRLDSSAEVPLPDGSILENAELAKIKDSKMEKACIPSSPTHSASLLRRTSSSPEMKGGWNETVPQDWEMQPELSISPAPQLSPPPTPLCETSHPEPKKATIQEPITREIPPDGSKKWLSSASEKLQDMPAKDVKADNSSMPLLWKSPLKEEWKDPILEEPKQSKQDDGTMMPDSSQKPALKLDLSGIPTQTQELPSHSDSSGSSYPQPASILFKPRSPPCSSPLNTAPVGDMSPPPSGHRERVHTISVMSPVQQPVKGLGNGLCSAQQKTNPFRDIYHSGLNPSFVFLHLYHSCFLCMDYERPVLLPKSEMISRAMSVLDHIPPFETHKIGVIYVGPGQVNSESSILSNKFGSARYAKFLEGLGTLVRLQDIDPQSTYTGGLDLKGEDGKFAYSWQDDIMQVIFHVASLMPNKDSDPTCTSKKLHIGNDYVTIVYNDSEEDYNISTIRGHLTYCCVIIHPREQNSNVVVVKTKADLADMIGHSEPHIVSEKSLPVYARQIALHASLASVIFQNQYTSTCDPYVSNWLERLRKIKQLHTKIQQEMSAKDDTDYFGSQHRKHKHPEDFTYYC